jgi:uncharacterized protein (TIGR03118 family)
MKPLKIAAVVLVMVGSACDMTQGPVGAEGDGASAEPLSVVALQKGSHFTRVDLVTDQGKANVRDPNLVNAWGLTFGPTGLAWVSSNGKGAVNLYGPGGKIASQPIALPPALGSTDAAAPTGQVFNTDTSAFTGDRFIVATEDGTIAGWQTSSGTSFTTRVDNSNRGAVYKGIAIASSSGALRIFATDFHNGAVDVFDQSYVPVHTAGGFTDPELPARFAPFNVMALTDVLLVTYAMQDKDAHDDVAGPANGYVNVFDTDGRLLTHLINGGALNSPWGMALAPWQYGTLGNRLLIGNFGDGRINAYRLDVAGGRITAQPEGTLRDARGQPLVVDGLWSLAFGPGVGGLDQHDLFFTAGPNEEKDGAFGFLRMSFATRLEP